MGPTGGDSGGGCQRGRRFETTRKGRTGAAEEGSRGPDRASRCGLSTTGMVQQTIAPRNQSRYRTKRLGRLSIDISPQLKPGDPGPRGPGFLPHRATVSVFDPPQS